MDLRHLSLDIASILDTSDKAVRVFAKLAPSELHAQRQATAVIERVIQQTGITPRYNFRSLDEVLHVSAPGTFIKELLKQPEVIAAARVPETSTPVIPPINARRFDETSIDRTVHPIPPKKRR